MPFQRSKPSLFLWTNDQIDKGVGGTGGSDVMAGLLTETAFAQERHNDLIGKVQRIQYFGKLRSVLVASQDYTSGVPDSGIYHW